MTIEPIDADITRIRHHLAAFFENILAKSQELPPPGPKATNGYFVTYMREDLELGVAARDITTDTPQGATVAALANLLMAKIRAGFAPGNHGANWAGDLGLALAAVQAALPNLVQIAKDTVIAIYAGRNPGTSAAIGQQIEQELHGLIDNIGHDGPFGGEHANGFISSDTRDRMGEFVAEATAREAELGADLRDFVAQLKVIASSIGSLGTDGHDPWLKAEWQVGFTGFMSGAAKVMRNPPEN